MSTTTLEQDQAIYEKMQPGTFWVCDKESLFDAFEEAIA